MHKEEKRKRNKDLIGEIFYKKSTESYKSSGAHVDISVE